MGKKIILLLPCLISLLSISGTTEKALPRYKFITIFPVIGPFNKYESDYELIGKVKPQYSYSWVRERLSVGVIDHDMTYYSTKAAHAVTKNEQYDLTFILPFKTMLGDDGLECQISFIDQDSKVIEKFSFRIRPKNSKLINPSDYRFSNYTLEDTIVNPSDYGRIVSESFRFNGFIDYFNIDTYYRLNLDNLYLSYSSIKGVPNSKLYLQFNDYDNLFPGFSTGGSVTFINIPLKLVSSATALGELHFAFDTTLYVNPKTLDMSLDAKPDYVLTNYFYLPINRKTDFMNQKFTLYAPSFGHNETTFSWDMRYLTDRGLIGDCNHSDYCVRGEL